MRIENCPITITYHSHSPIIELHPLYSSSLQVYSLFSRSHHRLSQKMAKYLPSVTVRRIILCLLAASPPFGLAEESQTSAPNRHHDKNISSISNKIRFLAIGDWGGTPHYPYSTHGQLKTARGMARVAAASSSPAAMNHDVDHDPSASFVLALGDNFYRSGVDEKDVDIRFNETFEKVYGQEELQIPW